MTHSIRKCMTLGVATITASAIAFAPSVEPVPPPTPPQIVHVASPAIMLTAEVQPLAATSLTDFLAFIEHYVVPPSASAPFPTPQFPPVVAPTSVGSSLIWIYNSVEPWVRYGFDLAAYAVGWVPYVGWLAPQIPIFYNFGERIARSITYNIAYFLDGNISFGQGLINVGIDTVNALIQLGIDQWNFWLWPLPPLPPIFPGALAATTAELTTTAATVTQDATSDAPQLKKKDLRAAGEAVVSEASTVDAVETAKAGQEPEVDTVKTPKEPKATTSSSENVAAQGEVRNTPNDKKTEASNTSNGHKKGANNTTATSSTDSSNAATSNDDTTAKHDKGEKKGDTGKKE
jgi:hypothetical protein